VVSTQKKLFKRFGALVAEPNLIHLAGIMQVAIILSE